MIVAVVAALVALPFIALKGRALRSCLAFEAAIAFLAWVAWLHMPADRAYLGCTAIAVLEISVFFLHLAFSSEVRWSANRAALIAAILYGLAIPAVLRVPIDGDEPFYLLLTESIVHDHDLDLANQYRTLDRTASGRTDLAPQMGDPVGPHGEQYSRHEPFLPLLMVPGYLIAGLPGAVATIALFGVLLVRSTVRWMEDEGIPDDSVRAVFPLFALGPPVLYYSIRIWPEVPAAFFFVESLRGIRNARPRRWMPALLGLVLLKLRFVLVAAGVVAAALIDRRAARPAASARARVLRLAPRRMALFVALALLLVVPLAVMWLATGHATSVHTWRELVPVAPSLYARGLAGLLADGMSGIAFQAPFYLLGLFALTRWRTAPRGFRLGVTASLLYVFYLAPRGEWFGGWAPPLRYLVFLMPVLALGAAAVWQHVERGFAALAAAWTAGLVVHAIAYPWRLFHIANGENALGEWLSNAYHADFSRFFPSFIRPNPAMWIGFASVVVLVLIAPRLRTDMAMAVASMLLAAGFVYARQPAERVDFEDAHVVHDGGELYPQLYTVMRVNYSGGWVINQGEDVSFLAERGRWRLRYLSGAPSMIEIAGRAYQLPMAMTGRDVPVEVPQSGRVTLRCLSGAVNLDRMTHE